MWSLTLPGWPVSSLKKFAERIAALPDGRLTTGDLMTDVFLLDREGELGVYYVPFEQINTAARVVLIGITPGFTQMRIAFEVARDGLRAGLPHEEILEQVDRTASFAGSMRTNLDRMLDDLGLPGLLGITETEQLFGSEAGLMHSTSALRNPVFVAGRNYTGSAPSILESPLLRRTIRTTLGPELAQVPDAVLIPLGKAAEQALEMLATDGTVARQRCCLGFPHPSGANGHRARLFALRRNELAAALAAWLKPKESARVPDQAVESADVWQRVTAGISAALEPHERAQLAARLRSLAGHLETGA